MACCRAGSSVRDEADVGNTVHSVFANFPRMGTGGGRTFARSFVQPSHRPGTRGMDEFQMLQLLDEGIVKRGLSDRKLRSLPIHPVDR